MSLHKLTAGSGYDYLTRQVAAMDATEKGHTSLASYYTEKGEVPGRWVGSGLTTIDGLDAGDVVAAEQMKALFGYGFHPLSDSRLALLDPSAGSAATRDAQRLGTPFKVYEGDAPAYLVEVARRIEDLNVAAGKPRNATVPLADRAKVRTEVANEFFEREHGRAPADARELAATVAKHSRPKTTAVAGFDLTFSPVKSVSALWAIADTSIAARIETAHNAAVDEALGFIEREALYTRRGTNGVRQVDVNGLVATAFTHRDSRAGDPDLHTHVAVANKVQATEDGSWLAIDGRVLLKAAVTASEVYNTALEKHLVDNIDVRFAERVDGDVRKRPIREIVGVDPALNARWSSRRLSIETRKGELTVKFQAEHSRPPTPVEAIQLAQQATLETRDAKHEPRTLEEQRQLWRSQAIEVLGDEHQIDRLVKSTRAPHKSCGARVDSAWVAKTADEVITTVQKTRSTWQATHLKSEALRRVRGADLRPDQVADVVQLITDGAVDLSIPLITEKDPITDPAQLRRRDASSVYTVAGSSIFTSREVLSAEQRIVAAAARSDGRRVEVEVVNLALIESAANGVELNAGQAAMVRGMATSGARVQLGIAAAGTGKTTAMSVLTRAWIEGGGNVIGLAPSAAAAAQLREKTGATTDTLAKLIHSIGADDGGPLPDQIGPDTLVLIDEAGMADTLALDTAIGHVLARGGSVRLIGDDQQLAAIGAGGVLRDIDTQHGAIRLAELMRFSDPAEGAASLALREGLPEALGFYLDNDRIHVGDLATLTDQVFNAWRDDKDSNRDAIMLAPTRELVAELNARARAYRLTDAGEDGPTVRLSDGNDASVGDVVLTRRNNRRLAISATDWVKNGDRWTVTAIAEGNLHVRHNTSGLSAVLPAPYVAENTELGYASTVHAAQGVSVDAMYGIATGNESRQQLYTMLTRGRHANHTFLVTASDGDPHNLIRPETVHPRTPTDILHDILARDGAPVSATTTAREAVKPTAQLGPAVARYDDALYVASRDVIGAEKVDELAQRADQLVPGIGDEPAWPVLHAHLVLRQAQGLDALNDLERTVTERELDGADDRAALLDWRLDPTGLRGAASGPLPWLPAIPDAIAHDTVWGPYLAARATRVASLASAVRQASQEEDVPSWARQGGSRPSPDLLAAVAVWRAAVEVESADRRPTGARQLQKAAAAYQRDLEERLAAGRSPALATWGPLIDELHPRRDAFTALLAERLAAMGRAGIDAETMFRRAVAEGPLPDEHVAAAMWWRIARHLSPTVAADHEQNDGQISAPWSDLLIDSIGSEPAGTVMGSRQWPTLVATVDAAIDRGWQISDLMDLASRIVVDDVDLTQAMIWRLSLVTDPAPDLDFEVPHPDPEQDLPPEDLDLAVPAGEQERKPTTTTEESEDPILGDGLAHAAQQREWLGPLEVSDTDINRLLERAYDADTSPVSPERIYQINELTTAFYEDALTGSWAHSHLRSRLGTDPAGDARFRPGYAPEGWTNLVDHLRAHGISDNEMISADVAQTARNGRLIDRFRDRAMLPVLAEEKVIAFVGRRNPNVDDVRAGPKYLNTRDTVAFHKGAQLYGIATNDVLDGAIPVIVEGPVDAMAITLSSAGAFVGVAPLGTSLTDEQATQLANNGVDPIVATDGDLAGRVAADRDLWILTPYGLQPSSVVLGAGQDPASILEHDGPAPLVAALQGARPLADELLTERIANIYNVHDRISAVGAVIAVLPPDQWRSRIEVIARQQPDMDSEQVAHAVVQHATRFNTDRRRFTADLLGSSSDVRRRLEAAADADPADRWARLARQLDPRLISQPDWAATAQMLQDLHDAGRDVTDLSRSTITAERLGDAPAQDLRYRLVAYLDDAPGDAQQPRSAQATKRPESERLAPTQSPRPHQGPRR